jgi:predicted dinucleotide-binding enzyme
VVSTQVNERRLGIVGAGKLGTALARAALDANYEVRISGSGPAERVALIVDVLAHGAQVMSTVDVVAQSDVIVLAVPVHRFRELPRNLFNGKILIDAMNYWYEIDGDIDDMVNAPRGTSVMVQEWFLGARVVKSLNQLGYHEVEEFRRARGEEGRIGVAVAGNDEEVVEVVMALVDDLGFDPIYAGSLDAGIALQTDGVAFGVALNVDELARLLSPFATNS